MEVDLSAIRHNVALVRQLAGEREVIASIKANAYGFGAVAVASTLVSAGVRKLWTGNADEAVALREAGIDAEILLFGGPAPDRFEDLLRYDLQPTVFDATGLRALARASEAVGRRARAWIKLDAGLGRLGAPIDQALAFVRQVAATPQIDLRGVYSHLPFSSPEGRTWAVNRYSAFERVLLDLRRSGIKPPITQVWGSSGLLAAMPDVCNAVCVGHALYGLSPLEAGVAAPIGLRAALHSLSAGLLRVDEHSATIAVGLGDGLWRADSGKAHLILGERRVPIRAFTLEHLIVDHGGAAGAETSRRATLIGGSGGSRIALDDWAEWTGASPLELMMSLSGRSPVRYLDEALAGKSRPQALREDSRPSRSRAARRLGAVALISASAVAIAGAGWDPLESTCRHASLSIL